MANKNQNFNFENFAISMIKAIDMLRSKGTGGITGSVESRINAFYRGLGLPSIIVSPTKHEVENPEYIDKRNTENNFFKSKTNDTLSELLKNGTVTIQMGLRENDMWLPTTDEELETFLDNQKNRVTGGLPVSAQEDKDAKPRKRGILFPMLVNGSVGIYPKEKRVGAAFAKRTELMDDKVKYRSPLIETILAMRLSGEGTSDTNQLANTAVSKEIKKVYNELETILFNSTNNIADLVKLATQRVSSARQYTGQNIEAGPDNIASANVKTKLLVKKLGQSEKKIATQKLTLLKQQARLAIFDFDDTFGDGSLRTRNLKDPVFASYLVDVLVGGDSSSAGTQKLKTRIEKSIQDNEVKLQKHLNDLKLAYKELDLVLGTFSGISGTDILAIIIALFKVETSVLIGLLNDTGKINLKLVKGIEDNSVSMPNAVLALQTEVVSILTSIDKKVRQYKQKRPDKRRKKNTKTK